MTSPPAVSPEPNRLSPRSTMSLLAGRGLFRGCQATSAAVLHLVWSETDYAYYAAAMASAGWLTALAAAGVEKTMIALAPRPAGAGAVSHLLVVMFAFTFALAAGVGLVVAARPELTGWAAAALYGGALGAVIVAVAALRLTGTFWADPIALTTIGAAHVVVVPLASIGWSPQAALGVLSGWTLVVATVVGCLAWRHRQPPTGAVVPGLLSKVLLTGCSEVSNMIAVAVVFTLLAASPHVAETGDMYLAALLGQLAIGAAAYLVRLRGASVSRLAHGKEVMALAAVAAMLRRCSYIAALHLGGVTGIVLAAGWVDTSRRLLVVAVTLLAVLPTLVTLRACSIAEFTGQVGRRSAAIGSVAGLLCASLAALVLVPGTGAAGGVIALAAGVAVQGALAARLLDHSGRMWRG